MDKDNRVCLHNKFYDCWLIETEEGIVVDLYSKKGVLLDTITIWNEDYDLVGD